MRTFFIDNQWFRLWSSLKNFIDVSHFDKYDSIDSRYRYVLRWDDRPYLFDILAIRKNPSFLPFELRGIFSRLQSPYQFHMPFRIRIKTKTDIDSGSWYSMFGPSQAFEILFWFTGMGQEPYGCEGQPQQFLDFLTNIDLACERLWQHPEGQEFFKNWVLAFFARRPVPVPVNKISEHLTIEERERVYKYFQNLKAQTTEK